MVNQLVIDTDVLIEYQRKHAPAQAFLEPLFVKHVAVVHPVSANELLDGVLDRADQRRTVTFITSLKLLRLKSSDFDSCLSLLSDVRLSHGVHWPDCLIAATCIRLGLPLVTLNDKHFRAIRGLRVVRPY